MSTWRLEWLRLTRTPRAVALAAVFVVFGLGEPVLTKYINKIIGGADNAQRVKVIVAPPTPSEGINAYLGGATEIGLIVVIAIAVGAFNFDSRHGLATFLRTRVPSMWQLITPRFVTNAAAAAVAYMLGTFAAWYETNLLIGSLPAGPMFEGMACGAVYLIFAVALSALAASLVKNTLGAVGLTVVLLLTLPIAASDPHLKNWLPSTLVNAPVVLLTGTRLTHFVPALIVSLVASALLLTSAVVRLRGREV